VSGLPRDGWTISQTSNFAGSVSTELTATSMRMRIGRLGLTILSKAPDWTAYVYNENNKNYCEIQKGQWGKKFTIGGLNSLAKGRDGKTQLTSQPTGKTMKIFGYKVMQVEVIKAAKPELDQPAEKVTEVWIAADIHPPPPVSELFCQHLNIPVQKGIPLRMFNRAKGKMVSVLDTLAIKKGPIAPETFDQLKGYKKVQDEMQLIMDDSTEDMIGGPLDKYASPTSGPTRH
jgi:hypothetical protein